MKCRNCKVLTAYGVLCLDCVRMIFITVISELVIAAILFLARAALR